MRVKHAAVVAGLALGLMSGTARAASLEYNIILPLLEGSSDTISGTIDTDGKPGALSRSDILGFDLFVYGNELTNANSILRLNGTSLFARGNTLNFSFDGKSGSTFQIVDFDSASFELYAGFNSQPFYQAVAASGQSSFNYVTAGSILTIGISEGTVSTVPLPPSAPMFGAALMALGAVGYGVKRKGKAAA